MIQSLRANARPKHKAYQDWTKSESRIFKNKTKLVDKKISKEKLVELKFKYKKEVEQEQRRSLIKTVFITLILIPSITIVIFQFFFKTGNENYKPYESPYQKETEESINKQINTLLNSGYNWLNKNHFKNARFQFKRVLEIQQNNESALFGMTASYVYECKMNNSNCNIASRKLKEYISKYGSDTSTDHLTKVLNSTN